jgi:hypothetical protein
MMKDNSNPGAKLGENEEDWPEIAIVILNWNNYEDTADCLNSIKGSSYPNVRTIVVDNGSTDKSPDKLQDNFEGCDFILNEENLGFAAGCNVGIQKAKEVNSEYILLLNNDIIIEQNALRRLVSTAESRRRVAAVSGLIYNSEDSIWFAGGKLQPSLSSHKIYKRAILEDTYSTEFITGALMLLNADFLDQYGGLDESYFFGREDAQLSYDATQMGWNLYINPDVTAIHDAGSSAGSQTPFRWYHTTRNRIIFVRQLSLAKSIIFYAFFILSRIVRFGQWTVSRDFQKIRAVMLGIMDEFLEKEFKKPEYFDS